MTYTSTDIESFAEIMATHKCESNSILQDMVKLWVETLNEIKEEYKDNKEIISQLMWEKYGLCQYQCDKKEGPINLIFNTPLDDMPLYINSKVEWQAVISLWRLAIDK